MSVRAELTPRDIYDRSLRNLMESAILELDIVSVDSGGHDQRYRVEMMWRRYPEGTPEADESILSRAMVRYLEPQDLRQFGVLAINRLDRADEQYVYTRGSRRVRRYNLTGHNVFGTDFSVDDLVPRGLRHASYRRLADGDVAGTPSFVVEALFAEDAEAQYSRGIFHIEKERFVPLFVRYWDRAGVEVKRLHLPRSDVREIQGLHVPLRMRIESLLQDSYTELKISRLVPNPPIPESWFTVRHLEEHATGGIPRRYYRGGFSFER